MCSKKAKEIFLLLVLLKGPRLSFITDVGPFLKPRTSYGGSFIFALLPDSNVSERERLTTKYNNGHPSIFCDFILSLLNSKLPDSCFSTSRLTKSLMMWSTVSSAASQDSVSSHGPTNSHSTGRLQSFCCRDLLQAEGTQNLQQVENCSTRCHTELTEAAEQNEDPCRHAAV